MQLCATKCVSWFFKSLSAWCLFSISGNLNSSKWFFIQTCKQEDRIYSHSRIARNIQRQRTSLLRCLANSFKWNQQPPGGFCVICRHHAASRRSTPVQPGRGWRPGRADSNQIVTGRETAVMTTAHETDAARIMLRRLWRLMDHLRNSRDTADHARRHTVWSPLRTVRKFLSVSPWVVHPSVSERMYRLG